jgi:uncharacterized protein
MVFAVEGGSIEQPAPLFRCNPVMPRYSVIIPVFKEGAAIDPCLSHLAALSGIGRAEVIVVDGDSGSTTGRIRGYRRPFLLRFIHTETGRGLQLNRGAAVAKGEVLIFLHVDTRFPVNALAYIDKSLNRVPAGAFSLYFETRDYFIKSVAVVGNLRNRITRVPYGDQAHFMSRTLFDRMGGYSEIPIMEDVEFMRRLKKAGVPIGILPQFVHTSDRRFRKDGAVIRWLHNQWLMLRYRSGLTPSEILLRYKPHNTD